MTQPYIGTHIIQITDTFDDDAVAKIKSAYILHISRNGVFADTSIIPAVNSITVGAKASEIFNNTERPDRLIVAVNFAPPDRSEGTENNVRNDFFCADLGNGVSVCGTSNGYEFSYLKPEIKELYRLTNTNSLHSQFRSLQILPQHAVLFSLPEQRARLVAQNILERVENVDDIIPSLPDRTHVLQVDNFGNVKIVPSKADRALLIKLACQRSDIHFAFDLQSIEFCRFGGVTESSLSPFYKAVASETLFKAPLGTNVVATRSSSYLSEMLGVPIIATIRQIPAATRPTYNEYLPKIGDCVLLTERPLHYPAP